MATTIDAIRDEIRALRLDRDRADARMLLRLVEIEHQHMGVIRHAGCATFAQFLGSLDNIVSPARYENFKAGLAKVGTASAVEIGSEATIVAGLLTNGPDEFVEVCQAWVSEHDGVRPTQQTAKHLLLQVDPRREVPQAVRAQDELARLRAQVTQLKAENAALKRKLAKFEQARAKKEKV